MKSVGEFLRLKRQELNYTLEIVANKVGVSINYISKLEKGENSNPSDEVIVNLAKALHIDEDDLFNAFRKIPLSTRKKLFEHPALSKAISEILSLENVDEEEKDKILKKTIYWYKKLIDEETKRQ